MNYLLYSTILFIAQFLTCIVPFEPHVKPRYTDWETEPRKVK